MIKYLILFFLPLFSFGQSIYTTDGTLTGDRNVNCDSYSLLFYNVLDFQVFSAASSVLLDARTNGNASEIGISAGYVANMNTRDIYNQQHGCAIDVFKDSILLTPYLGQMNIDSLRSTTDTTLYKPMVWNTQTGEWRYLTNWNMATQSMARPMGVNGNFLIGRTTLVITNGIITEVIQSK